MKYFIVCIGLLSLIGCQRDPQADIKEIARLRNDREAFEQKESAASAASERLIRAEQLNQKSGN